MSMRIKKNLMIVAALAAAAIFTTSCSQDETLDIRKTDGAIGFSPLLKGATATNATRMVDGEHLYSSSDEGDKLPLSFDVWAFALNDDDNVTGGDTDGLYMGAKGDGIRIFRSSYLPASDNTNSVTNSTGETLTSSVGWTSSATLTQFWGYDKESEISYWPKNYLRFYAVAPAKEDVYKGTSSNSPVITSYEVASGKAYFSVKLADDNMDDILVGTAKEQRSAGNGNSVNFEFRHALAKVQFKGKLRSDVNPKMRVEIKGIEIHNLNSEGTCYIDPSQSDFHLPTGMIQWGSLSGGSYTANTYNSSDNTGTNNVSTLATYILDASETGLKKFTGEADVTDYPTEVDFGTILAIPQFVKKWVGTAQDPSNGKDIGESGTTGTTDPYIKIFYQVVSQNDVTILDNNDVAYVPLDNIYWEAGKFYTYTLQFGLGYNNKGKSLGAPITFTVSSVSDWTATEGSNVNLAN